MQETQHDNIRQYKLSQDKTISFNARYDTIRQCKATHDKTMQDNTRQYQTIHNNTIPKTKQYKHRIRQDKKHTTCGNIK